MIEIYRGVNVILKVRPNDKDECKRELMGSNTITLTVERRLPFEFCIGDYLMFSVEKYTLNVIPEVQREGGKFVYNLVFEGIGYELRKAHMLYYTANLDYVGGANFSLMGNAELHARVIVENLNRVQSGWTLGSVVNTIAKNLTYAENNCLEAIGMIADEFDTEFWIGADKTVNIGISGNTIPLTLQYGKGKGLYSIERKNVSSKDIVTRLYPFGSSQNLPKGYRSNAKCLQIEGEYIQNNTDVYGVVEGSETFDDIKPERTGTITAIDAESVLKFSDSSMFDLNETDEGGNTTVIIPGTTPKIHFQTGDLAGYEFDLSGYDHTTKTFTIKLFTDEVAYDLPNSTLKPRVGDEYVILDIYMPQSYVTDAEARLLAKAQESLLQNSVPNVSYAVDLDPMFIKNLELTYAPGDYVHVTDTGIGVDRDIRIKAITRNLVNTDKYEFELSDTVEPSLVDKILTSIEKTESIIRINRLADPARARRNYRVVQELQNAIFDQDGYFDNENIKPFSIETSMLSVGSKGQQFYTDCMFQTNYLGDKNSLLVGNGALSHFTIEDEIRNWTITGLSETLPDDNLRYIFIKCLKVGTTGQVVLSTSQLAIDDGTYYNFFAGVLSSVIDNARQVSLLFGFTTINGRFIKTGRIQSADGSTYFDLDTAVINGKITFTSGSSGYANLTDKPDLSVYALGSYVDTVVAGLQDQIDGVIDSWFYAYTPTTGNYPASEWTTETLKQRHVGDTFTNTQEYVDDTTTPDAGKSWRWVNNSGVYSWTPIADSDAVKALQAAASAQDTADGKRRVFTTQPANTDAYDVGDLWANATYSTTYTNDLLKCKTAKAAGAAFSISHWEKASKYTDDTAANAAATAAANAQTSANTANTLLSDIASDSKLTPIEKQSTKQEWDIIVSEKTKIDAQADVYGVSKTAYGTAYTTLSTYITPLLSDLSATSDIVGTTFRANFKNYYDARQDLLNAISTAAKTLSDNIQVGGTNIIRLLTPTFSTVSASVNYIDDYVKVTLGEAGTTSYAYKWINALEFPIQYNAQYMLSVEVKSAKAFRVYSRSDPSPYNSFTLNFEGTGELWKRVALPLIFIESDKTRFLLLVGGTSISSIGDEICFRNWKLEKGNRATDYSPNPKDVDALISTAQTTADNAATAAANAQSAANTANTAIANITSDDVLSASEKSGERSRWNDVANEKAGLNGQATAYSITTENAAYNTAFQNLANYLNNGVTWSSGIPSWLADANLGTNTTIVGSTYRSIWNAYFTARQTLMNAISAKAKTLADAAQTTASAAQADATLAVARTNGRTLIDGGIVETDVVLLGEDGNAGMSGIPVDNDNNPLPSRWAGGSYAQAIAGLATIVEWYNGDVKYGDLWIDSGGSVCIKDANGVTRVLLTRNVITTLAALAGSIQNDTVSNVANSNVVEGTTSVQLANSIVVNDNNSQVTVVCTLSTSISSDLPDEASGRSVGRSVVTLTLLNTVTLEEISLGYVSAIYRGSTITNQVEVTKQLTVAAGTYKLKITYAHTNTANCEFSSGVSASTTTIVFYSAVQRTELGKNGLGIIGNATNYLIMAIESGTFKVVEKTTGVYDRPGVLAAASVNSSGSSSKQWGAKVGSSSKASTGTYTINHSIGHANYSVQVTPLTASRVGYISAKTNSSVTIVMTNMSGTATDTAFDYNIIGNNQ